MDVDDLWSRKCFNYRYFQRFSTNPWQTALCGLIHFEIANNGRIELKKITAAKATAAVAAAAAAKCAPQFIF